jgi:hypothetical protein
VRSSRPPTGPLHLEINVSTLSSVYAQFSGALAGFVFTAFTIYLSRTGSDGVADPRAGRVSAALFSAFGALVLTTLLYTVLSGETSGNRAAIGLFVYGLPLGLAILTMFYSIVLFTIDNRALATVTTQGRFVLALIGPVLIMARINVSARNLCRQGRGWRAFHLGWIYVVALTGLGAALSVSGFAIHLAGYSVWADYAGFATAAIVAAGSPWINTRAADYEPPASLIYAYLTACFLSFAVFAVLSVAALS